MNPSRRSLRLVVGALALTMLAACSSSAASDAKPDDSAPASQAAPAELVPLTFGAPWNGTAGKTPADTGPIGYAVSLGLADEILAEHGFEYEGFAAFNNGPPVVQALQSGDVQVGLIGDTPAVQAASSGIDVPALVIAKPTSDIWFIGKEGGVSSIEELKGKKVALQFGSNFDKYGRAVLERAGILEDVELVNLLFADALPALQRGDVDAVPLPASTAGIWRLKSDFPILSKASEDDPDLLATGTVLTSGDTYKANPEIAAAVWEVYDAGSKAIQEDHDAYAKFVSDTTGSPVDVVLAANLWQYGTTPVDPDGLKTVESTYEFLKAGGTTTGDFDPSTWAVE
jgi:sulfonate transport system substrate-binding protein